jgi:putative flippase GtrA
MSMGYVKKIVAFRFIRFLIVGTGNTAINFALLNFAFYGLHQGKLVSSFIATGCAVVCSFVLNRSFVFLDKERPAQKLFVFMAVTGSGVLLIQNSVYALGLHLLQNHTVGVAADMHNLTGLHLSGTFMAINLSNVIASIGVMFWNYNGYRLFVFKGHRYGDDIVEEVNDAA